MTKITQLTTATLPLDSTDLVEVVQDVSGTPVSRKAPVSAVSGSLSSGDVRWAVNKGNVSWSDEFDDASFDPAWVRVQDATSITWREGGDVLSVSAQAALTGAASKPLSIMRPLGGLTTFTVDVALRRLTRYATNYTMWGPVVSDGTSYTTSNIIWVMPYQSTNTAGANYSVRYGANWTANNNWGDVNMSGDWAQLQLFRINRKASGEWQFLFSVDGISWVDMWGLKTFAALTPTHVGFGFSTWGSTSEYSVCSAEYIRVYASDLGNTPAQSYATLA